MARIITKELALKIVSKLGAKLIPCKSKAHDLYAVEYQGRIIATISVRRGSEKDKGHDHIPRDLHISPNQAKRLGQCSWKADDFFKELKEKGLIEEEDGGA